VANQGAGIFGDLELIDSTRSTSFVQVVGVGDIDGDGRKDIALSNNGLSWIRNLGSGNFGSSIGITGGRITYSSELADLDQDGDLDIVRISNDNGDYQLQVARNSGGSNPGFVTSDIGSLGTEYSTSLAIGDTNQDGFTDIHLLTGGTVRQIKVFHGTISGNFESPLVLARDRI
jgi:hypothetical protein